MKKIKKYLEKIGLKSTLSGISILEGHCTHHNQRFQRRVLFLTIFL